VFLKFEENKIIDKIDKSNLLLKFSILFKSETTLCCCYNIAIESLSNLIFTKFKNLLIIFATLDCVNRTIDKRILLF